MRKQLNTMKILVLNGSPRPHGSTSEMVAVFKESVEEIVSGFIDILNGLYREAVAFPL